MSEWLQKKESKKTESVMEIDSFVHTRSCDVQFDLTAAIGGDIIETAIELAPLDHDTSYSRKRVRFVAALV